jgi:hypothetical protein
MNIEAQHNCPLSAKEGNLKIILHNCPVGLGSLEASTSLRTATTNMPNDAYKICSSLCINKTVLVHRVLH